MIISKQFPPVGIDVQDPIAAAINLDGYLLDHLREYYNGKNYMSSHIINVERIVRRGELVINQESNDAYATIPVTFVAEVKVYRQGEYLTNAKVFAKNSTTLTCETDDTTAFVDLTDLPVEGSADFMTEGKLATIKVNKARYLASFENKISVAGSFSLKPNIDVAYIVTSTAITNEEQFQIDQLVNLITNELEQRKKLDLSFYEKLFVVNGGEAAASLPKSAKTVKLYEELIKTDDVKIMSPMDAFIFNLDLSSGEVMKVNRLSHGKSDVIYETQGNILIEMLFQYWNVLHITFEMHMTYNKNRDDYKLLWNLYRKSH